jgi:ribosomal protein S18 acetylase RimI-like enzyme
MTDDPGLLRAMTHDDVPDVLAVQEPGAVRALAAVFPQDRYPFPRDVLTARWHAELDDPEVDCLVAPAGADLAAFVALRRDELLHLGVAVEHWGTGLADRVHDAALGRVGNRGFARVWAHVYTGNGRARRFYERHDWHESGERSRGVPPPHAELLRYERALP